MSQKKAMKREEDWLVRKEVLGWPVGGRERTLKLTSDKVAAYASKLKKLLRRQKTSLLTSG